MNRCGRTLALRSLLLATALSFAGSQPGWSASSGGTPIPAAPGSSTANAQSETATNLLLQGNSLFLLLDPTFQTGSTTTADGKLVQQNAATFTAIATKQASFLKQLLRSATPGAANLARALLKVVIDLSDGYNSQAQADWSNSVLATQQGFGPWSSAVVQQAQTWGVDNYSVVASLAEWAFGAIYTQIHGYNSPNPFPYTVSRETNSTVAFTDEPPAGLPDDIALAYASILKGSRAPAPPPFVPGWTSWASGYGGYSRTNGDPTAGTGTLIARLYGSVVGLDYHFTPQTVLGFSLGGAGLNWNQAPGSGNSDSLQIGVHGTTHFGAAYVSGMLDASTSRFSATSFAAGDELAAKFNAQTYGVRLEGGYRYAVAPWSGVAPYAAVQLQYLHTPGYSETDLTGGGQGVNYNTADTTDTRSELGARFDSVQIIGNMPVTLRARVAWAHDWLSNSSATAAFQVAPGANFIVNGTALVPNDSALTSLEAEFRLAPNWSLAAKFDGQFASSSQTYLGTGTLHYSW
jgi:hypothetical protein